MWPDLLPSFENRFLGVIKISFIQKRYRKGNSELSTLNLKILKKRSLELEENVKKFLVGEYEQKENISHSMANSYWGQKRQLWVRKPCSKLWSDETLESL